MFKNPFLNSIIASGYIAFIVFAINKVSSIKEIQETILIPIIMLSLLVLSVSLMAVLFFYQPIKMYLENKKKEAIVFFIKTIASFGIILLTLLVLLFLS